MHHTNHTMWSGYDGWDWLYSASLGLTYTVKTSWRSLLAINVRFQSLLGTQQPAIFANCILLQPVSTASICASCQRQSCFSGVPNCCIASLNGWVSWEDQSFNINKQQFLNGICLFKDKALFLPTQYICMKGTIKTVRLTWAIALYTMTSWCIPICPVGHQLLHKK